MRAVPYTTSVGVTSTRTFPVGIAGEPDASRLITSLDTSNFVTFEKSTTPGHGGWDAKYGATVALQSDRPLSVNRPSTVTRKTAFFASNSRTQPTENLLLSV